MQFLPVGRHAARLFLFYIPSLDLLAAAETLMRDQRADYAPFRTSSDDGGEVLWYVMKAASRCTRQDSRGLLKYC